MKKIILGLAVIVVVVAGYFAVQYFKTPAVNNYSDLLQPGLTQTTESSVNSSAAVAAASPSLNDMLQQGIATNGGILKSAQDTNANIIKPYYLQLNDQPLKLRAVSPISLIKAFQIESNQVLLFSFNQGGNQCGYQYQFLTITPGGHRLSEVFGNCLEITNVAAGESTIEISMPRNNPYLGADISESYQYQNGLVRRLEDNLKGQLQQRYADFTAAKILQIAASDGCYEDGLLLMDNSCGNGKKYCVMFRHLSKPRKDAAYKTLRSFCSQ